MDGLQAACGRDWCQLPLERLLLVRQERRRHRLDVEEGVAVPRNGRHLQC